MSAVDYDNIWNLPQDAQDLIFALGENGLLDHYGCSWDEDGNWEEACWKEAMERHAVVDVLEDLKGLGWTTC